jgi:hypothetical protein
LEQLLNNVMKELKSGYFGAIQSAITSVASA